LLAGDKVMIVVVTGMVGIDKKQYLQDVVEFCKQKGKDVQLFNVGDMMYAEEPEIPAGRILDISLKHLKSLRRAILRDIIAKKNCAENVIINTHATFRWQHGLFPAFDFDLGREIGADMYVCIIDGIDTVHVRLNREHQSNHTLKDLLVWREEEILATRLMCEGMDKQSPFYILGRGLGATTVDTFYSLMFEPQRKKVYLSFPITHVVNLPEVQASIAAFRARMKQHLICFDPADVEESGLMWEAHRAAQEGQSAIEVRALDETVRYDIREITEVEPDINRQIYARDFMLIDQADMIVSFIPGNLDGRAIISSGVERELQHAHESGKEAFVVWTAQNEPSVFVTETAKVFRSPDEAIKFFKKKKYFPMQ
jgi:adenylate kinase